MSYEYIRVRFDFGDLAQINRLSQDGWRVIAVVPVTMETDDPYFALMERERT